MQQIFITLNDRQVNVHRADGANISSACGDSGAALSASELVAAALGSCIAASLVPICRRHALDASSLHIVIQPLAKELVDGLNVQLRIPACGQNMMLRLRRAAEQCPVRHALNIPVNFDWQSN